MSIAILVALLWACVFATHQIDARAQGTAAEAYRQMRALRRKALPADVPSHPWRGHPRIKAG